MEHTIVPAGAERTAPARVPYRPLFFAALLLLAALAGLWGWLAALRGRREEALAQAENQLAQARAELDAAQDTIALLEEYSLAAPDGTVPEYTALCPDLYAPAWEGEAVTGGRLC